MRALGCRLTGSAALRHVVCFAFLSLILFAAFGVSAAADETPPLRNPSAVPRPGAAALSTGSWYINRIDPSLAGPGADRGKHISIAIRSTERFISYYDATDTSMRVAYLKTSGGNCGPGNTWWCEVIDNNGNVGQWSSIAATPSGKTLFGIAYYDATNYDLKFASYSCLWGTCSSSPQTVMTGTLGVAGVFNSVKYDTTGAAHIAFQAVTIGPSVLAYAHSVPNGGNCGVGTAAGKWQCNGIEQAAGMGQYASLDLDSYGQPRIAYYDAGTHHLKYASFVGSGGNCGNLTAAGKWQCDTIDDVGDVGRFASLRVSKDGSGTPFIAYYDYTNGKLKMAVRTVTSGNCGPTSGSSRTWQCYTIADMGTELTQAGVALELVGADEPVISYMDKSNISLPSSLKLARATRVMAGQTYNHNCGPYPSMFAWWCESIDGGGVYSGEGTFVSMAADHSGRLSIAYYESDSQYATGYFKLADQGVQINLPLLRR